MKELYKINETFYSRQYDKIQTCIFIKPILDFKTKEVLDFKYYFINDKDQKVLILSQNQVLNNFCGKGKGKTRKV